MRIGLLAFSTDTGLGRQTHEFYKHMKPAKTLLVDLSGMNNMQTHHDRFPDAQIVKNIPTCNDMAWLASGVDLIFVCETPLNYCLFEKAEAAGIKTVLQYNYEFLDYLNQENLPRPSVLAAPTQWGMEHVKTHEIAPVVELFVPVNDESLRPREITVCRTIMHIAGKQAIHDRNGTELFIRAALKCGDKFKFIIYAQWLDDRTRRLIENAQQRIDLQLIENVENYEELYETGDVLVLPRKYGGLCLPQQEALASGIPVIMPNISPNDSRLPHQWLVQAERTGSFETRTTIGIYETDANHLAFKMCEFADPEFMAWSNKEAISLGKALSWQNAIPQYKSIFEMVLAQ